MDDKRLEERHENDLRKGFPEVVDHIRHIGYYEASVKFWAEFESRYKAGVPLPPDNYTMPLINSEYPTVNAENVKLAFPGLYNKILHEGKDIANAKRGDLELTYRMRADMMQTKSRKGSVPIPSPLPPSVQPKRELTFEERILRDWRENPAVRLEFGTLPAYHAYEQARRDGLVKIYGTIKE